jgi:hypothetical protein
MFERGLNTNVPGKHGHWRRAGVAKAVRRGDGEGPRGFVLR